MKKYIYYLIGVIFIIIIIKYFTSNYEINYQIKDYQIKEIVKNETTYIEVKYDNNIYTCLINKKRNIFKKMIKKITKEEINDKTCLTIDIGYTICNDKDNLVTLDVLNDSIRYIKNEKDFYYNKNLEKKEYLLIWKYDGFYYLNDDEYKSINIFNKDRYSNDLMIQIENYLIFPKYDDEYMFNDFIILNIKTGDYSTIKTKYNISYEAYYSGNHKNKVYLFDNKNNNLYEINYKKNKVKIVGDTINGFFKYVNNKKVECGLSEYKEKKITYFKEEAKNIIVNNNYLSFINNKNIRLKFFNEDVNVIDVVNNKIYFIYKDNIYKYEEGKILEIAHFFELNFNNKNNVFIYSE